MRIPIDGKLVIEKDVDGHALCEENLGTSEPFSGHKGGIPFVWLRKCYISWRFFLEGKDLNYYIQAFVLYLNMSAIAPSSSHVVVPVYLLVLKNIEEIRSYAWGMTLLANLHCILENHIKYGVCIYANVHFIMMRIACIYIISFV